MLLFSLSACTGPSQLDAMDSGKTTAYEPGLPNFDLEAVATLRDGQSGFDLYLGIPPASLVFSRNDSGFVASYTLSVRVQTDVDSLIFERLQRDTLRVTEYDATQTYRPVIQQHRLSLPPGVFVVEASVRDGVTGKEAVRQQRIEVPALVSETPALSRIVLQARRGGDPFEPLLSFHLPARLDSMRAVIELYHAAPATVVELTLAALPTDQSMPQPPYWLTPMRGSLAYLGVRMEGEGEIRQRTRREIAQPLDELAVEFALPALEPGMYRLRVEATGPAGGAVLVQERVLSVMPPSFPRIVTLEQMIEALVYIADPGEIREINEATTAEEKRQRFDAFWGSLVGNRQLAQRLILQYYARVEEANQRFTTHKEGWKTDRGMVFIVLGPPLFSDDYVETQTWHYRYAENDPRYSYTFERVRPYPDVSFGHYVLQREAVYDEPWRRAIQLWRQGRAL